MRAVTICERLSPRRPGPAAAAAPHHGVVTLSPPYLNSLLPASIPVYLTPAGTIFGGAPEAIARGRRVFMAKVEELLKAGIPDMDQPVWGMILKANSTPDHGTDLMEPYYTVSGLLLAIRCVAYLKLLATSPSVVYLVRSTNAFSPHFCLCTHAPIATTLSRRRTSGCRC